MNENLLSISVTKIRITNDDKNFQPSTGRWRLHACLLHARSPCSSKSVLLAASTIEILMAVDRQCANLYVISVILLPQQRRRLLSPHHAPGVRLRKLRRGVAERTPVCNEM
jgi:hypothetical protein